MEACAALPADSGFLPSILAFLDCQGHILGTGGYQALSAPGSTLSLVLGGFLTLFVALFGYRLLLGRGLDLRTSVIAFVKLGAVLALATSWPAYRALVYDVAVLGPGELAAQIAGPSRLPGAGGGLVSRLDGSDRAFVALAVLGEGVPPAAVEGQAAVAAGVPPQPYPGFNTFAIASARMLFLVGAIAGLGALRLIVALALAAGPLFVLFLLFDNTRSVFEGWVRVVAGAALGTLGAAIALGAELALLEPWLYDLLARRGAGEWMPGMPVELLVVTVSFALIVLALLYASAKIASAFRFAPIYQAATALAGASRQAGEGSAAAGERAPAAQPGEQRSRAAAIADAVVATQRREARLASPGAERGSAAATAAAASAGGTNRRATPAGTAAASVTNILQPSPLGQSFRRRTRGRVSASAGRRDRRS
ncbi:MAG TPA: type IV secretion system protein [Allosphingosinicella sp.]|jgi:type IV secretion system protein VirB6